MFQLTPEEQITLNTYNNMAVEWDTHHHTINFWPNELMLFKQFLPNGKILEIGSGGGRDAKLLSSLGYDYIGTDISPNLIKQAKFNNPQLTFFNNSIYDLDFAAKFDGFWCSAVLLHIPRDRLQLALQKIKQNMKQGAIGFISIKEGTGEVLDSKGKSTGNQRRYIVYWSDGEFTNELSKADFTIIHKSYRPINDRSKWLTYFIRVD